MVSGATHSRPSPSNLPPLPFGGTTAQSFEDVRLCGDFLAGLPDAPSQFDAIGPGRDFRIKLRPVPIPDVTLLAGASSPKATSHASDRLALVIRRLCSTIDASACDVRALVAEGIDDAILRTVVTMLAPDLVLDDRLAGPPSRAFDLEPLLERVRANIAGRVTLADMEEWSGRSARTIQLAFQALLGVGPMQWVRDQRLDLIHDRLRDAPDGATVANIAKACGIHRIATLTPAYFGRFGERPSETLARRRRR